MAASRSDLSTLLTTAHPARPYLLLGGGLCLYGLLRSGLGAILMLGAGGAVLAKGLEEVRRVESLHDGNAHGVNAPPMG